MQKQWKNYLGVLLFLVFSLYQNFDIPDKSRIFFLSQFGSLEEAVRSVGSLPATLIVDNSVSLMSNLSVPASITVEIKSGGGLNLGPFRLTLYGQLIAGRIKVFSYDTENVSAGLVTYGRQQEFVYPEWYGAVPDARGSVNRTDWKYNVISTQPLQFALNARNVDNRPMPVLLGLGGYMTGPLRIPAEQTLRGISHLQSFLVAVPNFPGGPLLTDQGNAAKIILENFTIIGNMNPKITALVRLGYNGVQWGTQGFIRNLWVRDAPEAYGLDVSGNVAFLDTVISEYTKNGIRIEGHANMARNICVMHNIGAHTKGFEMRHGSLDGLEVEAPAALSLPILITESVSMRGITVSFNNSEPTQFSHIFEIAPTGKMWLVEGVTFFNSNNVTITGGLYKIKGALSGGKILKPIVRFASE